MYGEVVHKSEIAFHVDDIDISVLHIPQSPSIHFFGVLKPRDVSSLSDPFIATFIADTVDPQNLYWQFIFVEDGLQCIQLAKLTSTVASR